MEARSLIRPGSRVEIEIANKPSKGGIFYGDNFTDCSCSVFTRGSAGVAL
jgi:hypothetical protein